MAVIVEQKETGQRFVVIGAIAAVIGAVMAATALLDALGDMLFPVIPPDAFRGARVAEALFFGVRFAFRFVFGFFALLAGVHLVRGRHWARVLLEVLGWVGSLFCLLYVVIAVQMELTIASSRGGGLFVSQATSYLVYAALLGTMIYHLHKASRRTPLRE